MNLLELLNSIDSSTLSLGDTASLQEAEELAQKIERERSELRLFLQRVIHDIETNAVRS